VAPSASLERSVLAVRAERALDVGFDSVALVGAYFPAADTRLDASRAQSVPAAEDSQAVRARDRFFEPLAVEPRRAVLTENGPQGANETGPIGDLSELFAEVAGREDSEEDVEENSLDADLLAALALPS
jgi:hypothetical protein